MWQRDPGITFKVDLGKGLQNQIQQQKHISKNSSDQSLRVIILMMYLKTVSEVVDISEHEFWEDDAAIWET